MRQPAPLAAAAAGGNHNVNSKRLALPFSFKQVAKLRQLGTETAEQLESMRASQEDETVKVAPANENTNKSHTSSPGQGMDSSSALLKESPLLPQLIEYCDQRMAMLSAPPERLAAIEQVPNTKKLYTYIYIYTLHRAIE